jgi:hypothetical protein
MSTRVVLEVVYWMGGRATERFVSSKDGHAKLRKARAPQIPQSGMRSPRPVVPCAVRTCSRKASPKMLVFTSSCLRFNACHCCILIYMMVLSSMYNFVSVKSHKSFTQAGFTSTSLAPPVRGICLNKRPFICRSRDTVPVVSFISFNMLLMF